MDEWTKTKKKEQKLSIAHVDHNPQQDWDATTAQH